MSFKSNKIFLQGDHRNSLVGGNILRSCLVKDQTFTFFLMKGSLICCGFEYGKVGLVSWVKILHVIYLPLAIFN